MFNLNLLKDIWQQKELSFNLIPLWLKALIALLFVGFVVYQIYAYGVDTERARWQLKENAELVQKQAKILELQVFNRELERAATLRANALQTVYEGKLKDEKQKANRIIASISSGAKRLSIGTKTNGTCASAASSTTTANNTGQTETRAELSTESSQFLVGEALRADQIVLDCNYSKDLLLACYEHVEALNVGGKQ